MTLKQGLKSKWKKYVQENKKYSKISGNHHYFRTRYASRFWLQELESLLGKREMETII